MKIFSSKDGTVSVFCEVNKHHVTGLSSDDFIVTDEGGNKIDVDFEDMGNGIYKPNLNQLFKSDTSINKDGYKLERSIELKHEQD